MKRRVLFTAAAAAAALALAGCGKESSTGAGKASGAQAPVSLDTIAAQAKGFNVGSTMSTRVVYVFFDPQCPHCAALWQAAKPLKSQGRFVWIPVAMLNDKSAPQGATLLAAADPIAAMDQHEASLREKRGGIAYDAAADSRKEAVKRNTALLTRFGLAGVPAVVAKHAVTGELVTLEGSMPTATLAQRLGLQAP